MSSLKAPTAIETVRRMNRAVDTAHLQMLLFVHRRDVADELGPEGLFSAVRTAVLINPNPGWDSNHSVTADSRCLGYLQSSSGMVIMSTFAARSPALRARERQRSDRRCWITRRA